MNDLIADARRRLSAMEMPEKAKSIYPQLNRVAADMGGDYSTAVGAVFQAVSAAVGVKYGSQYMSNVIVARFNDGTLKKLLSEAA